MTKRRELQSAETKGERRKHTIWSLIAAGFGMMLVVSFLAPVDSISVFVGSALPQNLGWLLLAVLAAFASRGSRFQVRPSRTEILCISCGLGWLIVVTWLASEHGNARAVWNGFWHVISLASCFYIGRAMLRCSQVRALAVLVIVVGCLAMSFVGLEQVLISLPANRVQYAENPDLVLAENGFDAPPGSPRRAQFEDRLNSPEPFANFALANSLASLLCLGVILTGGLLANSILRKAETSVEKKQTWNGSAGLLIVLLIQLICLLLTRSRTAYLSILVALALWLILEWTRGKVRLTGRAMRIAGIVLVAFALVGFGWLLTVDRLVWSEAPKSISYRLEYWQATLAMIRDYAWTGVGLGNFQAYYPQYKLEQASEIVADPHNWVLDVAATLSVPIAVFLISWVGVTVSKGISASLTDDAAAPQETESHSQLGQHMARGLVLGATVGGGLSAILLGFAGNLDLPTNLTAWGWSAVLGWWIWRTNLRVVSAANVLSAIVALLLCLLSSGSWQASGIAIPLIVLLSISWQLSARGQVSEPGYQESSLRMASWLSPLLAIAGLAIFVLQTWRPVMQSWMLVENAATARSAEEQFRFFELAAAADPLDTERAIQKVQLLAVMANQAPDEPAFAVDALRVMDELKRISPPNVVGFMIPKLAGEISSQLAANAARRGSPNQEYLKAAGGFYSLAVERYPSSVEMLVQHAAASSLAEDWRSADKSLEKAYQISDQTPHFDKKLAAQMILLPLKPSGFESQSDYVPAEPFADWLRTEIKAKLR